MSEEDQLLTTERRGAVLIATINRPRKGNALSVGVIEAIADLIVRLRDDTAPYDGLGALVITGSGPKVFSAGADIANLVDLTQARAEAQMLQGQAVFSALEDLPHVVIAAINGIAFGGGLELAMACDLRIAAPSVLLGQPEITLGNLPGWAGTQRLPRLVGEGRALEMILTGEPIPAERAHEIGLVNHLAEDTVAAAVALAERVVRHAAGAVAAAKQAVYVGEREGIDVGSRREAALVGLRCVTPEQRDAVEAFLNRRKPTPTS